MSHPDSAASRSLEDKIVRCDRLHDEAFERIDEILRILGIQNPNWPNDPAIGLADRETVSMANRLHNDLAAMIAQTQAGER